MIGSRGINWHSIEVDCWIKGMDHKKYVAYCKKQIRASHISRKDYEDICKACDTQMRIEFVNRVKSTLR